MSAFEKVDKTPPPTPSPRGTGLTFVAVMLIVAVIFREKAMFALVLGATAMVLAAISFLAPSWLKGLAYVWGRFAYLLGAIINPIVMSVLFFGFLTPYGLLLRLVRDPLRMHKKPGTASYWVEASDAQDKASMERQF